MIRLATGSDISRIVEIYDATILGEEMGLTSIGWRRGIYPTEKAALDALSRGDLFVFEDHGVIAATAVINQNQADEYAECMWRYPASDCEVMVLHTLAVDPKMKGRGIGSAFIRFYEEYAKGNGCKYLRMDTNEENSPARRLYRELGFEERGSVYLRFDGIPNVYLMCYEKKL